MSVEAFEAQVRQHIKLLSSPDARTRRKAAEWLGESADPQAITRLKQVYQEDPDRRVRQAAGYALGMFRALQNELAGNNRDQMYGLVEGISMRGEMGRRVPVPTGVLSRLLVALMVSAAMMAGFLFWFWPRYEVQIHQALGLDVPADTVDAQGAGDAPASEVLAYAVAISADAVALRDQYAQVAAGGTVDCTVTFREPIMYNTAGLADTALEAHAIQLNGQLMELMSAKSLYLSLCAGTQAQASPEALASAQARLEQVIATADETQAQLAEAD